MQATITSTTEVVDLIDIKGNPCVARAWEGISAAGVPFTAYLTMVQVHKDVDNSQFEAELQEHKAPEPATRRAIDFL
jgi:hypothetical protein